MPTLGYDAKTAGASIDPLTPVNQLVLERPGTAKAFELFGIDYCCDGARPLAEACKSAKLSLEAVLAELVKSPSAAPEGDWRSHSITELANYIVEKHHVFTRAEITRLSDLIRKVVSVHSRNHPELLSVQTAFGALTEELRQHMSKEEDLLFPYVKELEESARTKKRAPDSPFGSVQNPVAVMIMEHEASGQALEKIRALTGNYSAPSDACASYRALYEALPLFAADLHQHIHLENNILFPRAIQMENDPNAVAV
jgi:regulator of cell morphogenesis and NO signaling